MENKKNEKSFFEKWWVDSLLFVFIIIISFIVTFAMLSIDSSNTTKKTNENKVKLLKKIPAETLRLIEGINNNYTGSNKPIVTIVEFTDFSCILCKNSFPKIRELGIRYKDHVKIIFRDYPLISENSMIYAEAARCAGEQNKFLEMHDGLFINQDSLSKEGVLDLATKLNMDMTRYRSCLQSEKYRNIINKDISDANSLGVGGTPTFFINGHKVEGGLPGDIETIIKNEIANETP